MPDNRYVGSEYITFPFPSIRMGKTGEPETITAGGVLASGTITYANNPTATDTITINGVVFTYIAAGAAGNQINIGADLPATLVNTRTVLNASTDVLVNIATYSDDTATILNIVYDTYGVAGNVFTLVASADTVSAATLTGGTEITDADVVTGPTNFSLTQAIDQNFTLADGDETQRKLIYASVMTGAGNAVVTPDNLTGGTTITLNAALEYSELRFLNGSWVQTAGTATVA